MYHEALQEQAEQQRERDSAMRADRLGLPVVSIVRAPRASVDTFGSDLIYGPGHEREAVQQGGNHEDGNQNGRVPALHSTRASSGVFPEERERERNAMGMEERERNLRGSLIGGSGTFGNLTDITGPGPPPGRES